MPTISVRISDELKEKMEQYPEVNWSQLIRERLADELEEKQGKRLSQALLISEKLSGEISPEDVKDQNSAERIRSFRENR